MYGSGLLLPPEDAFRVVVVPFGRVTLTWPAVDVISLLTIVMALPASNTAVLPSLVFTDALPFETEISDTPVASSAKLIVLPEAKVIELVPIDKFTVEGSVVATVKLPDKTLMAEPSAIAGTGSPALIVTGAPPPAGVISMVPVRLVMLIEAKQVN